MIVEPYGELYELKTAGKALIAVKARQCSESCIYVWHTVAYWHRRFGNRNFRAIKDSVKERLATGIAMRDCTKPEEDCEC